MNDIENTLERTSETIEPLRLSALAVINKLGHAFFHFFGVFGYSKFFYEFAYLAFHNGREIIHCKTYAMVGNSALRVIVGSDFVGSIARAHHRFSVAGYGLVVFG
jgi:hypothetical protein